jgi:hypothetical protein
MIEYPWAIFQAIFEMSFKAVPIVKPLKAEPVLLVLAVHGDLEFHLIRELPDVPSLAMNPVSLENPSARQSCRAITMGLSIEKTSDVLSFGFESLECPMSLNLVILELSFIYITIRESLLAQPMSQAFFECPFILAAIFELEYALIHLVFMPVPFENLAIRVGSVVIHVELPSVIVAFFVCLEVGVGSLS